FRVSRCLLRPDLYDDLGCARIGRRGHGGDPLHGESLDPRPREQAREPREALEQKVERGKAIVLFSDGGDSDPAAVREVAVGRELGIAVLLVGIGTPAGGVVYDVDEMTGRRTVPKRLPDGSTVISRRDDAGMTALAAAGGDAKRYFLAADHG